MIFRLSFSDAIHPFVKITNTHGVSHTVYTYKFIREGTDKYDGYFSPYIIK